LFAWTTSSWFLGLLVTVLAVSGSAGVARYYHRRRGKTETAAISFIYGLTAVMMLLLATVFIVRLLVEIIR